MFSCLPTGQVRCILEECANISTIQKCVLLPEAYAFPGTHISQRSDNHSRTVQLCSHYLDQLGRPDIEIEWSHWPDFIMLQALQQKPWILQQTSLVPAFCLMCKWKPVFSVNILPWFLVSLLPLCRHFPATSCMWSMCLRQKVLMIYCSLLLLSRCLLFFRDNFRQMSQWISVKDAAAILWPLTCPESVSSNGELRRQAHDLMIGANSNASPLLQLSFNTDALHMREYRDIVMYVHQRIDSSRRILNIVCRGIQ